MKMTKERNGTASRDTAADILRVFAFLFVVCVHSYLNGDFYYQGIARPVYYLPIALRVLFMCCVPLFLMLSGYLNLEQRPTRRYFLKILRVLFIYLCASLCCEIFRCIYYEEAFSPLGFLFSLLSFEAAPYAWYVHMYLGFFFLFPFLNAGWRELKTKRNRLLLVGVLLALTALPSFLNTYCFTLENWWLRPSVSDEFQQLVPQWWQVLYPFSYYFLGAWFKTYPPKPRPWLSLGLLTASVALFGLYNTYRSWGGVFAWETFADYPGFQCVIVSCLFFWLWQSIPTHRFPLWLKKALSLLSQLTLGAYLTSWIFDELTYPLLNYRVYLLIERLPYFPLCVLISVAGSLLLSLGIHLLWKLLSALSSLGKRKPQEE